MMMLLIFFSALLMPGIFFSVCEHAVERTGFFGLTRNTKAAQHTISVHNLDTNKLKRGIFISIFVFLNNACSEKKTQWKVTGENGEKIIRWFFLLCLTHFCWNEGDSTFMPWLCPLHSFALTLPSHVVALLCLLHHRCRIHFALVQFSIWFSIIIPSFYCLRVTRARTHASPMLSATMRSNHRSAVIFCFYLYPLLNSVEFYVWNVTITLLPAPLCTAHSVRFLSLLPPSSVSHWFAKASYSRYCTAQATMNGKKKVVIEVGNREPGTTTMMSTAARVALRFIIINLFELKSQ